MPAPYDKETVEPYAALHNYPLQLERDEQIKWCKRVEKIIYSPNRSPLVEWDVMDDYQVKQMVTHYKLSLKEYTALLKRAVENCKLDLKWR